MIKLLLILLALYQPETDGISIPILSDIQDIIGLAHDISDIASGNVPFLSFFTGKKPDPVQAKLDGLSKQIEELSNLFSVKLDNALVEILTNVPRETDFRSRMATLNRYITRVNFLYDNYRKILKTPNEFAQFSIDQFVEASTSLHDGDIPETLNQMHRLFSSSSNSGAQESFLSVVSGVFMEMDLPSLCSKTKSQQQRVFDIYQTVAFTEIKGFIMNSYAYGLLGIQQNISFAREIKRSEETMIARINEYISATKVVLFNIPREIYICDPPKHKFGVTYTDLRRSIQRLIFHEWMLRSEKTCRGCGDIDTSTIYRNYSDPNSKDKKKQYWSPSYMCNGRLNECRDLTTPNFCEIEGNFKERLMYIKSINSIGIYGHPSNCYFGIKSYLESFFWDFNTCEVCLCTCTEEKKTSEADRTISLRAQRTDIDKNMVLTGLRFIKEKHILHLQIEQGKLIKNGAIEEGSVEWVELEDMEVREEGGDWMGSVVLIKDGQEQVLKADKDFRFIDYKNRFINLDMVTTEHKKQGWVLTGAALAVVAWQPDTIGIQMRLTRYDYATGQLLNINQREDPYSHNGDFDGGAFTSHWWYKDHMFNENRFEPRKDIDVKGKSDPSRSYGNIPNGERIAKVALTYGDEPTEVGQNTVPYFDAQTVAPVPRVALDGLGLYLRQNDVSGGFISIAVIIHNISSYMNPIIDPNSLREGELLDLQEQQSGFGF